VLHQASLLVTLVELVDRVPMPYGIVLCIIYPIVQSFQGSKPDRGWFTNSGSEADECTSDLLPRWMNDRGSETRKRGS
jgi:hypothetical protein